MEASIFSNDSSYGLGLVLRDDHGRFVTGKNMRIQAEITVLEAEASGVQEAINWIETLDLHGVSIESDSELVVKAIHNNTQYYLEIGHTIEVCKRKLSLRPDLSLSHIKKQANRIAHLLARAPCSVGCINVFEFPPNTLL